VVLHPRHDKIQEDLKELAELAKEEQDPALVRQGRDPQLEKAVEVLKAEIK
jgi:hypothetical protein